MKTTRISALQINFLDDCSKNVPVSFFLSVLPFCYNVIQEGNQKRRDGKEVEERVWFLVSLMSWSNDLSSFVSREGERERNCTYRVYAFSLNFSSLHFEFFTRSNCPFGLIR